MGGGDSGPTTNTTYTQAIPPELMPYATKMLGYAENLSYEKPLGQVYGGQMTAGINPLQQQAIGSIQGMQPSQYLGQGAALAGMAGTSQFTGDTAQQYMSPYMQNVVSQQQQGAVRDYARQLPGMGVNAARAGAMGGTRSALVQAEGQRNLQNQLGDIQAKGLQSAYDAARSQFNTQNQNMLTAAGQLGQFGAQDYTQNLGIAQAQMGAGNALQGAEQNRLNAAYQQWVNAQMEPYQRLNFMSSLIRGTPIQNVGSAMYQPAPSTASQILGAATGVAGLTQAYGQNKKEGGEIKGYAGGGIVSLAKGGSTKVEKMGAIDASTKQLSKAMPPQAASAKVQQTISALPDSIDWQNAAAMMAYTKAHPATVEPPKQDSVVVQMAKQIAMQADAEKMAEAQKAQQAQQEQMAMQQMQQAQQQGVAGLPNPNMGQNFTPNGITAEPQGAPQGAPQVNAAEGGGVADLQSNMGEHYAGGGIVAFSGEDGDQEVEEDDTASLARRLVSAMPGTGSTLAQMMNTPAGSIGRSQFQQAAPQQASAVPSPSPQATTTQPAILTNAGDPTAMPGSSSILQSKTLTPVEGSTFNRAPYAQTAMPDRVGPLSAEQQSAAFNRTLNSPTNAPASPAAAQAPTRYDDSRYAPAAAATTTRTGIASALRPATTKLEDIPEVEDTRVTAEDYFKEYQKYKEKAGLNKATSDLSKFLDNEQVNAAKDAKYERALALAQFGFDIASTPGGLLRGIAAGGKGYTSALASIKKEQSATERSLAKSRLEMQQALAKDDMGAWTKAADNFRQDSKDLENQKFQRQQLVESQRHNVATEEQQRYATAVTEGYYRTLAAAAGTKTNATLEKYKNLFAAAIDKYHQTGDPRDKAAADQYQDIVSKLVDPTQTKVPAAISSALKNSKGVQNAESMLAMATYSGDQEAIAQAQAALELAKQQALAESGFTNQLASAQGTGLNLVSGIGGGAKFLGFE